MVSGERLHANVEGTVQTLPSTELPMLSHGVVDEGGGQAPSAKWLLAPEDLQRRASLGAAFRQLALRSTPATLDCAGTAIESPEVSPCLFRLPIGSSHHSKQVATKHNPHPSTTETAIQHERHRLFSLHNAFHLLTQLSTAPSCLSVHLLSLRHRVKPHGERSSRPRMN